MAASADPFISVCKVLEEKLKTTRLKFDLWKSTVSLVDTSADADCQAKRKDLEREIASASDGCFKMRKALDHVEQNRGLEKYSHIDDRELESRKAFVQRLEALAIRLKKEFHSPEIKGKFDSDSRKALQFRVGAAQAAMETEHARGNQEHLQSNRAQQQETLKKQDVVLDNMGNALDTLNEMGNVMQSELKDQDVILDGVQQQTDAAQTKMDQAIQHIEKLIGKPGFCSGNTCQMGTIGFLVILFVIVVVIALI